MQTSYFTIVTLTVEHPYQGKVIFLFSKTHIWSNPSQRTQVAFSFSAQIFDIIIKNQFGIDLYTQKFITVTTFLQSL